MPATRRGVPQANTNPYSSSGDYLRGLLPSSWTALVAVLVVFALVIFRASRAKRANSGPNRAQWFKYTRKPIISPSQQQQPQYQHQHQHQGYNWAMDEKESSLRATTPTVKGQHVSFKDDEPVSNKPLSIDVTWKSAGDSIHRQLISRPPPAPPLTPPELSTAVFTFEDRPRPHESFLQQPNPDYLSSTSTSLSQSSSASPPTPRRRSYNKTLPIGIPTPQTSSASDLEPADLTFSPSSFPPTSPLLPPAPPGFLSMDDDPKAQRGIDVQGEIISVLDGDGAGWTRHTRVYGGGVCLACAASGGDHGAGGFYGATVRPEEMR